MAGRQEYSIGGAHGRFGVKGKTAVATGGVPTWKGAFGRRSALQAELLQALAAAPSMNESDQAAGELIYFEEQVPTCSECRLPLGECAYHVDESQQDGDRLVHGECKAQLLLQGAKQEESRRQEKDAVLKKARRTEYSIGWKASKIPRNTLSAKAVGCHPIPQGMCCLELMDANRVRVSPTLDPSVAVNLEYLFVALKVRQSEGREAWFSLDPKPSSTGDEADTWQVKRFEPKWLGGTSVGEVMFQADIYLKELSMGEYEQPVVGMKSCFDHAEEESHLNDWQAREWFVVRNAEVLLSERNALLPSVKMGVEAREQLYTASGLEDATITRPDHPMVKYANEFTKYFDLIAERKSVVYHLRELAKASVLAKFLLEAGIDMPETWLSDAAFESQAQGPAEIPQLWNERAVSQIRVKGGKIVQAYEAPGRHGVYGGVMLSLDRLQIVPPAPLPGVPAIPGAPIGPPKPLRAVRENVQMPAGAMSTAYPQLRGGPRAFSFRKEPGLRPEVLPPSRLRPITGALSMQAVTSMLEPQGVDLNLDSFHLSEPTPVKSKEHELLHAWSNGLATPGVVLPSGPAFWSSVDSDKAALVDEDKRFFHELFNAHLSDRRAEGEAFIPPITTVAAVHQLKGLMKHEKDLQQKREEHFFSSTFAKDDAGPLFPSSWKSLFELAHGQGPLKPHTDASKAGQMHARPDYQADSVKVERILRSTTPVLDATTEEGSRFQIHQVGSLEVRSLQKGGEECTRQVYASRAWDQQAQGESRAPVAVEEKIVSAAQYVERLVSNAPAATTKDLITKPSAGVATLTPSQFRYFVVFETDAGNAIVMEKRTDGTAILAENPHDLEARISLAKAMRSTTCCPKAGLTVATMKALQSEEAASSAPSTGEQYAMRVYGRAVPAWDRDWSALSAAQRKASEKLGFWTAQGAKQTTTWQQLNKEELEAAQALGFDQASWDKRVSQQLWDGPWDQLTQEQQEAARQLGIVGSEAWAAATWESQGRDVQGSAWARSYTQLTEEERAAAQLLGIEGATAWEAAFWKAGGAWERSYADLTEAERHAAADLGVACASQWDGAWPDLREEVGGPWLKHWVNLTKKQQQAAKDLGMLGAAAWDTKYGVFEKTWMELEPAEQQAASALGVSTSNRWNARTAPVFFKEWRELSTEQRAAAERLGVDRWSWQRNL